MVFKQLLVALSILVWSAGLAAADPYRIVAFGDSLMAGYQLSAGDSFPEKLESALKARGHDVVISNAGVSGDTSSGGLSRLDWSVEEGTDLVILGLGANDMLRGVSPDITASNLEKMIERLRDKNADILLVGMYAAPNLGADYGERFNGIYPRLAQAYDLDLYPFFLEGVITEVSLLLDDRMHPNAQGVDRMVEGILPMVEAKLAASGQGS